MQTAADCLSCQKRRGDEKKRRKIVRKQWNVAKLELTACSLCNRFFTLLFRRRISTFVLRLRFIRIVVVQLVVLYDVHTNFAEFV